MDKHIQNPMEREPKECTHTHTHTDDLCIPVWPYGLAGTSYPPQRKCPFTVHSSVVCHHILSPSFKRQYEASSAQPSHSFEVKSSRKETQFPITCNQHWHEIWWAARNLKQQSNIKGDSLSAARMCEDGSLFSQRCWWCVWHPPVLG